MTQIRNKIKAIVRFLLPVIAYGLYKGILWLYNLIVYGGFDAMIRGGILSDGDARALHIFNGFLLFLLPLVFAIHWLICWLNKDFEFLNIRLGLIICTVLFLISCLIHWSSDLSQNIIGVTKSILLIYPPIILYFYGLNATKQDKW